MRIAIDTQTALGQKSGFGSYVSNLLDALRQQPDAPDLLAIAPDSHRDLSTPQRWWWNQVGFPARIPTGVDLIHQPSFSVPVIARSLKRVPVVVTIHDIIPYLFPENLAWPSRWFFNRWMPFSYRFADAYIVISEHTKRDLLEHYRLPPEKIRVIPLAAAPHFRVLQSEEAKRRIREVREKYRLPTPYFLHVATLEPRKNLPFLVRSFAELLKSSPSECALVITGKKGWMYDTLYREIRNHGLEERVILTGYVPDEEIPYLYNGAIAFLFPSLYEGFGLPPLEALSCGLPVISSNTSSLPEVIGEAGILVSPTDTAGWVSAMRHILEDAELRRHYRKRGLEQAARFQWSHTAAATLTVYHRLIDGRSDKAPPTPSVN
jgi:glycosyltransferase involved in cell wall biosynthesis